MKKIGTSETRSDMAKDYEKDFFTGLLYELELLQFLMKSFADAHDEIHPLAVEA